VIASYGKIFDGGKSGIFTRSVSTGWTLCCETWLKLKLRKKNFEKKMFGSWVTPLVGRHVVNELKIEPTTHNLHTCDVFFASERNP
jgi:hypothetical protein